LKKEEGDVIVTLVSICRTNHHLQLECKKRKKGLRKPQKKKQMNRYAIGLMGLTKINR